MLSWILFNLLITLQAQAGDRGRERRVAIYGFAFCDRVSEERQGLLEEVSEGSLELLDQRSVILTLENNVLWFGNVCLLIYNIKLKFKIPQQILIYWNAQIIYWNTHQLVPLKKWILQFNFPNFLSFRWTNVITHPNIKGELLSLTHYHSVGIEMYENMLLCVVFSFDSNLMITPWNLFDCSIFIPLNFLQTNMVTLYFNSPS